MKLNQFQVQRLVKIGLSEQEAKIYLLLLKDGPLTAKSVAGQLGILPNAVYRAVRKLERKNLVSISVSTPKTFHSLPPTLALASYAKKQALLFEQEADKFVEHLRSPLKNPTQVRVIFGKEPTHLISAKIISQLEKEGLFISIGEFIPENLLLSIKRAVERGVKIKLIVHKYDKSNKEIVDNFKKNGMEVRHYPDWGFHLGVYDAQKVLLVVNNPQQTDERIGILMSSSGLAKAMRNYFYFVWEEAVKV